MLELIDRKMGLGLHILNKWYFISSIGTSLMGVGFGIYLSAEHFFRSCSRTLVFTEIGGALLIIGAIITEISHIKLKKIFKQNDL
jgi:tetrahydromethanopterin S-methyltransferase subunit E